MYKQPHKATHKLKTNLCLHFNIITKLHRTIVFSLALKMEITEAKVTHDDCRSLLETYFEHNDFTILDYKLEPIGDDLNGYMGNHLVLKLYVSLQDQTKSLRFFIKMQSQDNKHQYAFMREARMFEKEMFVYRDYFQLVKNTLKNCDLSFAAKYYGNVGASLILEDLSQSGYKMPKTIELDKEWTMLGLESLAKLHATSFAVEVIKSKTTKNYSLGKEFQKDLRETMFVKEENCYAYKFIHTSLKAAITLIDLLPESPKLSNKDFKTLLRNSTFLDNYETTKFRRAVSHGDLWAKNVMFKAEENVPLECKILDFQQLRYCSPALDVLEWIHQVCTPKISQCYYHWLLDYYYSKLKECLQKYDVKIEDVLPLDDFEASCKVYMRTTKIVKVLYKTMSAASPTFFKTIANDEEKYFEFFFKDRSLYVIELFKNETFYKSFLTSLLEELRMSFIYELVTPEDMFMIIRKTIGHSNYKFLDCEFFRSGCYGDNLKMLISIEENGEKKNFSYFVKKMPNLKSEKYKELFRNSYLKEHVMFRKIRKFYENYDLSLKNFLSKCYFSRLHDVIVFDDLMSKGYKVLNPRESLSFDLVVLAVKKLAKFHAQTIILEKSKNIDVYNSFKNYFLETIYYMPEKVCNTFMNSAKLGVLHLVDYFYDSESTISKKVLKDKILKVYDNIVDYMRPSETFINTLCHGDLWTQNVMFQYVNDIAIDCVFVDFQSYRYVPPAHDLMSFMYLTTDRKFRRKYFDRVTELYYEGLLGAIAAYDPSLYNILPVYEDFQKSCKYYKLFGIAHAASHFQYVMLTEEQLREFHTTPGLCDKILFEDRTDYITQICKIDPVYKEKLRETIIDFQECCGTSSSMKKKNNVDRKSSTSKLHFVHVP